jgi:hypothetical protein
MRTPFETFQHETLPAFQRAACSTIGEIVDRLAASIPRTDLVAQVKALGADSLLPPNYVEKKSKPAPHVRTTSAAKPDPEGSTGGTRATPVPAEPPAESPAKRARKPRTEAQKAARRKKPI